MEDNELKIKRLELIDAYKIENWDRHNNELFIDYDLGKFTRKQLEIWFLSKRSGFRNKYFAIYDNENNFVGYIGMKDINLLKKSSVLGIVLDPKHMSKGIGYKSMKLFLKYYFDDLNMKKMVLDVNEFNDRAIKLYKKLGFKYISEYLGMFENQDIDFSLEEYEKYKDNFVISRGIIYSRIYMMTLDRRKYYLKEKELEYDI